MIRGDVVGGQVGARGEIGPMKIRDRVDQSKTGLWIFSICQVACGSAHDRTRLVCCPSSMRVSGFQVLSSFAHISREENWEARML